MKRWLTARRLLAITLCLTMALYAARLLSPAYAAGASSNVYTFGDASGPWSDLAKRHEEETKRCEKERKKAAQKQVVLEKKAMKKAAREARQREAREKAAKKNAAKGLGENAA